MDDEDKMKSTIEFKVTVSDPCTEAIVNSDNVLVLSDMVAPDNVSIYESSLYTAPSNSAQLSSGGLSNCGALTYQLLTKDKTVFDEEWFSINLTTN